MARISGQKRAGSPEPTDKEQAAKRRLLQQIDRVGWVRRGTLLKVFNRCGKPGCRCKADPAEPHGPYWQWTRKVKAKTISVRLTDAQARLLRDWLDNAKALDLKLAELEKLSEKVTNRVLAAAGE